MIHIIGDSHVSFFSGTTYMQPTWPGYVDGKGGTSIRASYIKGVRQYRLGPLTAYNFEKNASQWVQDILSLENIDKENDWIFFNLGEIDCSGHLPQQAEKTSIDKAVEVCVRKYVTYLASIKAQGYNVGVIGPHVAMWHTKNKQVLKITKRFNEMLMFSGFKYVSILDELLDNPSGDNYIDGYHLSPKVWPLFKEKFLEFTNLEDDESSINYDSYKDLEYWNHILPEWKDVNKKHIYVAGGGIFSLVMGMIYNMKWLEGVRETAGENIKNLFFQQNKEWSYDKKKKEYIKINKMESSYNPKDLNMINFIFDQPKRTKDYNRQEDYRGPGSTENCELNLLVKANQPDILFLRKLARKLKFNKRVKRLIKIEESKIDFKNSLGVHIRLTDMNRIHPEHGAVNFDDFVKNINLILEEHPEINTIFVASDNNESIEKLRNKYKDRVKFINNLNRCETELGDSYKLQLENYHKKEFWEHSFLDMMMLSKCKYLLHRTSNVANAALVFSDTIIKNYNIIKK